MFDCLRGPCDRVPVSPAPPRRTNPSRLSCGFFRATQTPSSTGPSCPSSSRRWPLRVSPSGSPKSSGRSWRDPAGAIGAPRSGCGTSKTARFGRSGRRSLETCICPVFRRRRSGSKRESPAAGEERFRLRPKPGSLLLRGARGLEAETAGLSKQRRRPGAIAGDPGALFVGAAQVVTALRVARLAGAIEERRGFDGVG